MKFVKRVEREKKRGETRVETIRLLVRHFQYKLLVKIDLSIDLCSIGVYALLSSSLFLLVTPKCTNVWRQYFIHPHFTFSFAVSALSSCSFPFTNTQSIVQLATPTTTKRERKKLFLFFVSRLLCSLDVECGDESHTSFTNKVN